ncbi:MAG: hypothetical protein C0179_00275 [Fervidicoccus sp.]|nr:MAG: hypothetical protein C0179_00275 [Fervidicoccus sp.]
MSDIELTRFFLRLGFTLSAAVILKIILSSKVPLTFREIVEKTGYAKGHVSYALKQLEARKIIERIYEGRKVKFKLTENAISLLLIEHLSEMKKSLEPIVSNTDIIGKDRNLTMLIQQLNEITLGEK